MDRAKELGCNNFVLFSNTPPVQYTYNGKGFSARGGLSNLKPEHYGDFAGYMADVAARYTGEGYHISHISPVNEPQYNWDSGQEGSGWTNDEVAALARELDMSLDDRGLSTDILLGESGDWEYLYKVKGDANRSNVFSAFFTPGSSAYVGDLAHVKNLICGHSYWTDGTWDGMRNVRKQVAQAAGQYNLDVWQSEWSMLGDNYSSSEFVGYEQASEMDIAFYMSKVIHNDLTVAGVSSWSYWTSMDVSRWGHKNRFLLISLVPAGGEYGDIEQEGSYQSENVPRYDAREVAKYLCVREKAALVFGSATPTVETAWAAEQGSYQKALLRRRYNENALPEVLIADLRQEILNGNPGLISTPLRQELEKNLAAGEQSILFLNRRGSSRMLLCGECGYVPQCPRCSTAMTYHSANGRLMCHYCGHSEPAADTCPECGGWMKHVGAGTQKVEEELRELFPEAGILRMDADTTAGGHEEILQTFERERVPILLGTQMVAKGLDFENVTLVGVLSADISLYVDNYRAAERTFSLLTQVVGRAGRGGKTGRAVIQTYTPGNDVIRCAARQDYDAFYESEIRMRRLRRYPPFADLFTVTVSGTEEGRVLRAAVSVRETLRQLCRRPELAAGEPEVLGPAPAPVVKVNNRFRYRCTLVGKNDKATREMLAWLQKDFAKDSANRGMNLFVDHNAAD